MGQGKVHDDLLSIILDEGHKTASAIWVRLGLLVKITTLNAQATSLLQLSSFEYPHATMLDNKGALLRIQKEIGAAFSGDTIAPGSTLCLTRKRPLLYPQ